MPLVELNVPIEGAPLPPDVLAFLSEADRRIERFQREQHVPAFVPSDFVGAYAVLRAVSAGDVAAGNLFCEWGSGFGVVACLAAMLDFDVYGIEIERELVDAAQQLADDFDLPVEFICGSFIPEGSEGSVATGHPFAWLTTEAGSTLEDMGLDPADFDVIFAYPWPDEESVIGELFEQHAGAHALLVTYHGGENLRLRRKSGNLSRKRKR